MEVLLAKLISIYSISGEEQEIAEYIYKWLDALGIEVKYVGENCISAFVKGAYTRKALILNGHLDTVPVDNQSLWTNDPLTMNREQDRAIGLGASDMKSGLVVMMKLAEYYVSNTPPVDLFFVFTPSEEVDGAGMRQFVKFFQNQLQKNYDSVSAVVLEPTDLEFVGIGHRGNVMAEVVVHGQSGHGSRPEEIKNNAIVDALNLISKIEELENKWVQKYTDPILGNPSIAISAVSSGDRESPNKFPSICRFAVDIRTTIVLHDLALAELSRVMQGQPNIAAVVNELAQDSPPAASAKDIWIAEIADKVLGKPQKLFPGATDLSFLNTIGIKGIVYGPGAVQQMHRVNESVLLASLETCYKDLRRVINNT